MGKRSLKPATPAPDVDDDLDEDLEGDSLVLGGDDDDEEDDGDLWDDDGADEPIDDVDANTRGDLDRPDTVDEELSEIEDEERESDGDVSAGDTEIAGDGETTGSPLASSDELFIAQSDDGGKILNIPLENIVPDPDQPRLEVDDELAASIKLQGVLQPITIRANPNLADVEPYMIEDGERRWRGAKAAGLETIRARVNLADIDAGDRLLRQVTLNDGKRLSAMEEAKAWKRIMDAKGWTIQQLAAVLGRAKSTVSDRLALLDAPAPFQALFAEGKLSAAAAPIAREYREVPERILKAAIKELVDDEYEGWGQFIDGGVPVPLSAVRDGLNDTILNEYSRDGLLRIGAAYAKGYTGPVATVKGRKYATDRDAYLAVVQAAANTSSAGDGTPGGKRELSDYELEHRERQRKERIAHEKKRVLRRAQFDALVPKLPSTLSGEWALLLITWLTKEIQQDYQRIFLKALGVEPSKGKGTYGGFEFQKTVIREAEKLAGPARVKFALMLLLAHDLQVSSYDVGGPDRFAAAAALLKVNLKSVKAPDPAKPKKAATKRGGK